MLFIKSLLKKIPLIHSLASKIRNRKIEMTYKEVFNKLNVPKRPRRNVLLYPDFPEGWHPISIILRILKLVPSRDINDKFLFAVKWQYGTYKKNDGIIEKINRSHQVLNYSCDDISKTKVDKVHLEVFGYDTLIDPKNYKGKAVVKSNLNAFHDGKIIDCPIEEVDKEMFYQVLINNKVGNLFEDIRTPIYNGTIPAVFLKYRNSTNRFGTKNTKVILENPENVLSVKEIEKILLFAEKMKLDFGEFDVLRDYTTNKIYVIDVNDAPGAVATSNGDIFTNKDRIETLTTMTKAFYQSYLKEIY